MSWLMLGRARLSAVSIGVALLVCACTPISTPMPANAGDGGAPAAGPNPAKTVETTAATAVRDCASGSCWWSGHGSACDSAGMPTREARPSAQASSNDIPDLFLGWTDIYLTAAGSGNDTRALGLDLDRVCTNAASCPDQRDMVSCRPVAQEVPYDGDGCRDNVLASVFEIMARVPDIGARFGLSEASINCGLARGSYNIVARISGYNGLADDDRVRVDWYISGGLVTQPSWQCSSEELPVIPELWRKSSRWSLDASVFADGSGATSEGSAPLPHSALADADAYVRGQYLVAQWPDAAVLRLAGDGKPFRGLALPVHAGLWTGRLYRSQNNTWHIDDGLVAGRIRSDDLLQGFNRAGFCEGVGADPIYMSLAMYMRENADVLASGANDPDAVCDAVSFGVGFHAAELTPVASQTSLPALLSCCAPGQSDAECQPVCGDGRVDGRELCDTGIASGQPGACPSQCEAVDACTPGVLTGTGCDAECKPAPITHPISGDGCCPQGSDSTHDTDCAAVCGNGVLERGESCDRKDDGCPACISDDPCLISVPTGDRESCSAECRFTSINSCRGGDRCCPKGCSPSTDSDCSNQCGNGTIESAANETCDSKIAGSCEEPCADDDPCTIDIATGSAANCNVHCTHARIVQAVDGDGCCPRGGTATVDTDCASSCGNGVIEGNEECDDAGETASCTKTCKRKSMQQMCTSWVGPQQPGTGQTEGDACSSCVCSHCYDSARACFLDPSARSVELCGNLVSCIRATWCNGIACYCGNDLQACLFGNPSGPCKEEVEAATDSTSASAIIAASADPNSPFGHAYTLGNCAYQQCADECDFH